MFKISIIFWIPIALAIYAVSNLFMRRISKTPL
jgi:hypothetical protein